MPFDGRPRTSSLATTLAASAARLATGNTQATPVRIPDCPNGVIFELDVTAGGAGAGDTLNVYVQTRIDGSNFVDVCALTQVVGSAPTKRYYALLNAAQATAMFENATALTAGSIRNILGDDWAVRWVIAGAGPPTFTFSVTCCAQ